VDAAAVAAAAAEAETKKARGERRGASRPSRPQGRQGAARAPTYTLFVEAALLLAGIRLALGVSGLIAALLLGVGAAVAAMTFALGIVLLGFTVISTRQGMWSGRDIRVDRPLRAALAATYPSTIGLTALTAFALVLKPQLAALTAGLLAGLALLAATTGAQIAWTRRSRRT